MRGDGHYWISFAWAMEQLLAWRLARRADLLSVLSVLKLKLKLKLPSDGDGWNPLHWLRAPRVHAAVAPARR